MRVAHQLVTPREGGRGAGNQFAFRVFHLRRVVLGAISVSIVVDEAAYRHAKGEINRLPCVFERALLARHAACELAVRHQIAERESIACAQPVARAVCAQMSALLRDKSAFALGLTGTQRILPHAMMMKIQCGGLDGLKALLDADAVAPDVRRLVRLAQERYGDLAALPFSEVVQGVAAWKARRRHAGER